MAAAAAAAITLREHAAEALLEVDMPQGDMPGVGTAVDMPGVEWARAARVGAVLTGPARGMAAIGTVAIIGTAIMGIIITAIM